MPNDLPQWNTATPADLIPFARVRLFAADLDGTLISPSATRIYERIEVLRRTLEHPRYRMHMTVATGRTYTGARQFLKHLQIPPAVPVILYNGAVVAHQSGHLLLRREIPEESLAVVVEVCRKAGVCCLAYSFVPDALGSDHEEVYGWSPNRPPYEREFNGADVTWNPATRSTVGTSAILIDVRGCAPASLALIHQLSDTPGLTFTSSGASYVELRPEGSDKAVALATVAAALGVSRAEVAALGDSDNDSEMLAWAGVGVAVSTASPRALGAASYRCIHGVEKGAVELLRLIKDAKRYHSSTRGGGA